MQNKPIIRHCYNCKYHCSAYDYNCDVKYKWIINRRLGALFCRYYKAKGGGKDAE